MATIRKQILLSESQNERLRKLREATGVSESEIVRRALEAYDPAGGPGIEADEEMRDALAALVEQSEKTARASDAAEAEIAATEECLSELRAKRGAGAQTAKRGKRSAARAARSRERKAAGAGR